MDTSSWLNSVLYAIGYIKRIGACIAANHRREVSGMATFARCCFRKNRTAAEEADLRASCEYQTFVSKTTIMGRGCL